MIGRQSDLLDSNRVRGLLWLLAGAPMVAVPLVRDGNFSLVGLGSVFVILGLVSLRRE